MPDLLRLTTAEAETTKQAEGFFDQGWTPEHTWVGWLILVPIFLWAGWKMIQEKRRR